MKRRIYLWCISAIMLLITSLCLTSCGSDDASSTESSDSQMIFVEKIALDNKAFLDVIESYTSGMISEGEPLKISFLPDLKLKKQYGESLPSDLFEITPKISGHPVWIDKNTVGFQFDNKAKKLQPYQVSFNVNEFIGMPEKYSKLNYNFFIKKQNFQIKDVYYYCSDMNTCSYKIELSFINNIDASKVTDIIDKDTRDNYNINVTPVNNNDVIVTISNIPRKRIEYNINVVFDGKAVDVKNTVKQKLTIPSNYRFNVMNYNIDRKENCIIFNFSNPLDKEWNNDGFIEFSEEIKYSSTVDNNRLLIYCKDSYNLDENFDITLRKGIVAANGDRLREDYTIRNLKIKNLAPKVRWCEDGVILPEADATLHFDAIYLNAVVLRVVKIFNNNIMGFLQGNDLNDSYVRRVGRLEKKVRIELDCSDYSAWRTHTIKLSDIIDIKSGDMYQIILDFDMTCYPFACDGNKVEHPYNEDYWDNEYYDYKVYCYDYKDYDDPCSKGYYNYVEKKKNIYVTNLAVTVKDSDGDFVDVFVKKITDGEAVAEADLQLFNYQMQSVAKAKTDKNGYARIQFLEKPYFVVAQDASGDKSFIKLEKNKSLSMSKFNVSGENNENHVDAYIYSNRDVWRPGDSIQLNMMLSDKDNYFSDNYPVIMELFDPDGRLYLKKANNSPVGKIYTFNMKTQVSDRTGTWNANFKIGNHWFNKNLRIETVKPNRLKIEFDVPDLLSVNGNGTAKLSSKCLNGMNVKGLKATIDAYISNGNTSFKNYSQYVFENVCNKFNGENVALFDAKLDDKGKQIITFEKLKNINAPGFLNVNYTIKVFEPDGQFSISSKRGIVSPYSRYVGVSLPEPKSRWGDYYYTDEDWRFNIIVVNEDGSLPSRNVKLNYQVYKLELYWWWDDDDVYDLMRYASGNYKRPVNSGNLTCINGKTDLKLNFKDDEWGAYLLVIQDAATGFVFSEILHFDWSSGPSRSSSIGEGPTLLTMTSDKDSYNVGENIKISFPASKNAKALVTVETTDQVIQVKHLDNVSDNVSLSIPVTADMVPNVYVYVSLIQPFNKSNGLPIRMYGVLPVMVSDENTILKPVVKTPSSAYSNTNIEIKVSESKNRVMYYTLAVVDEGILGITSYKTPDPKTQFFRKQALRVRTWDNYDDIIDVFTDAMKSSPAVGGGGEIINPESTLFKRFTAVAKMMGPFALKEGETNAHQFQVPDYNGDLRVMVVATNGKNAFGSAKGNIIVKDKIMIMPTAPRIVAPDDEIAFPITILAPELKGKDVIITINPTNLNLISENSLTLKVNKDGEANATLNLKVFAVKGNASVEIIAQSGPFTSKKKVEMPIRLPFSERHQMQKNEIQAHSTQSFEVDIQGVEGTISGKLAISTGVPIDLFKRLDYLSSYPYSCLEQKVSSVFPKLYINDLASFEDATKDEMKKDVKHAINELNSYLRADYSMTNWPGGNRIVPWTELYALHFLIEAKNQGYDVPDNMFEGIIQYQTEKAKAWNYSVDDPGGETTQAYRLSLLALNQTPETAALNRFKELQMKYPLSQALAASAYAIIGKTQVAEDMLPILDYSQKKWLSDYYVTYGSKTRDRAFCTYAEMLTNNNIEIIQNDINNLIETINSDEWLDTQTTAVTLFVLSKYAKMNELTNAPMSVNVLFDNSNTVMNTNKPSQTMNLNIKQGNNKIQIQNNGDSKIFATVYSKSMVAEYETEENGNWYTMKVNYFNKDGKPLDPAKLDKNTDFSVEITIGNPHEYQVTENALSYYLPSGWELINDRLLGNETDNESQCSFIDLRDDRAYFFFDLAPQETKKFRLNLNATYSGKFVVPSVHCEDMYNNEIYYVIPARNVIVK